MGKRKASDGSGVVLLNLYRNKALKLEDLRVLKAEAEAAKAAAEAATEAAKVAAEELKEIEEKIAAAEEEKAAEADSYIYPDVEPSGCALEADSQTS